VLFRSLERSTGAAEAQVREIEQLKAKEDQLMEEVEMIRKLFPALDAAQVIEIIHNFFPSLNARQVFEMIRTFPKLNLIQVIESIGKLFPGQVRQIPPSVKKGVQFDVPDGIIAHLTRECGGNVHDRHIVDVTSRSFEKELGGVNPHSGAYNNHRDYAAQNGASLETDSCFGSVYRDRPEDIPDPWNNWRLSEARNLRLQGPAAFSSSSEIGELTAVVGLRGGSGVAAGWRCGGWRMLQLEVGPTISRSLLGTIAIGVNHLLRSFFHLEFPNFTRLMRRSTS
jgi:hypothetical protein